MNHPFDFDHAPHRSPTAAGMPPNVDPAAAAMQGWPYNSGAYGPQIAAAQMQRYREMTIDELLLENRVIFLVGEINYSTATGVIMRLLHLQNQKKNVDINLYINSHGGGVDDTLAIYDTINHLGSDVATYCIGRAYSGAALILAAGKKGKRFMLPHARVMIHQPYGGVTGQTSDIQIQAEEILKNKRTLNQILADRTGQDIERVEEDSERDRYFDANQAKEYGIVDDVLTGKEDDKKEEKKS